MGHQIKEGPATILTVLNNHSIEAFQISIQNVFSRPRSDGKAFVIKVTDIELIRRTGGIVQGMSGSPIIQDGKLVGAVTHVLVNDPTRGYGVLSEMMLEEAGLLPEQKREILQDIMVLFLKTVHDMLCSKIYQNRSLSCIICSRK